MIVKIVLASEIVPASYVEVVSDSTALDSRRMLDTAKEKWSDMEAFFKEEHEKETLNMNLLLFGDGITSHGRTGSVDMGDTPNTTGGEIAGWPAKYGELQVTVDEKKKVLTPRLVSPGVSARGDEEEWHCGCVRPGVSPFKANSDHPSEKGHTFSS